MGGLEVGDQVNQLHRPRTGSNLKEGRMVLGEHYGLTAKSEYEIVSLTTKLEVRTSTATL